MSETIPAADAGAQARAVAVLQAGNLAVLPTDTRYAVVADAFRPVATQRLFGAKRRTRDVPLTVLIRSPRQVNGLVEEVPEAAERLMATYWPGPLTLVFRASDGLTWDLGETRGTVALRLPADDLLLEVIGEVGPLATSAANRRGEQVPSTLAEAELQLGLTVELYVDDGPRTQPLSTVVDVSGGTATVLREGAIPADHVAQVASGAVGWGQRPSDTPASPASPAPPADAAPAPEPDPTPTESPES